MNKTLFKLAVVVALGASAPALANDDPPAAGGGKAGTPKTRHRPVMGKKVVKPPKDNSGGK